MIEILVDYIQEVGGGVSFVELENICKKNGLEVRGEISIVSGANENLFLWTDVSREFYDICLKLISDARINIRQTDLVVYLCDGRWPHMPIAKRKTAKSPRWIPVCFHPSRKVA